MRKKTFGNNPIGLIHHTLYRLYRIYFTDDTHIWHLMVWALLSGAFVTALNCYSSQHTHTHTQRMRVACTQDKMFRFKFNSVQAKVIDRNKLWIMWWCTHVNVRSNQWLRWQCLCLFFIFVSCSCCCSNLFVPFLRTLDLGYTDFLSKKEKKQLIEPPNICGFHISYVDK